jgi:hypothetical protein
VGDYTELQIGPAATQEHIFPGEEAFPCKIPTVNIYMTYLTGKRSWVVLASSEYQWTEFYSAFKGDLKLMQNIDYRKPLEQVNKWLDATPELTTAAVSVIIMTSCWSAYSRH